jgi:EAL domain-containing protein (putative c-di-GMP-specific phosphodiesterase class I)
MDNRPDTRLTGMAARKSAGGGKTVLASREELLNALQVVSRMPLAENEAFLVVINIADTKDYDEIIRIFGYELADTIIDVRLASLDFLTAQTTLYNVGFWSVGFILEPATYENFKAFLDEHAEIHKIFLSKLVAKLTEAIICRGIPIAITSGIGVCDLKKGLGTAQDVLQATFIAGQVSARTASGYTVCNYDLAEDNRRAFSIIADVGHSLSATQEFELVYQPRTDTRSGHCMGAEALLRWRHPSLGMIPPNEFIPLIEMTGLIRELSNWVLAHAIRQAVKWQNGKLDLRIAVNMSVKNLDEDDFVERVFKLLEHFELDPKHLELEFSESRPFSNFGAANVKVRALRDHGISVAIDDFGTGQNSFAYLQSTPANILKIDQSLIRGLKGDLQKQRVVKSLIAMAHEIGMAVVAEGVESMEMLEYLSSWGCDCLQGYYISRPMYEAEFETWCRQQLR